MDMIQLYEHQSTGDGLELMMAAAIGSNDYVRKWVSVETALLIEAIARHAEDKSEWFPHGHWATMQAIQNSIAAELRKITWEGE